jgi:Fe-S-cluster-containing hydrogenase component 2
VLGSKPKEIERMPEKKDESSVNVDIYGRLLEAAEKKKREKLEKRKALLESLGVKEFFEDGKIKIDMRTCKGVECKLCIKACPTNALYWKAGEVGITEELCVYCTSCVLNCMVDNCIQVERKRADGQVERFGTPDQVRALQERVNSRLREKIVAEVFPDQTSYLKRYKLLTFKSKRKKGRKKPQQTS